MLKIGDRVVYTPEHSPDFPDAAYRGAITAIVGDGDVCVLWDDGEELWSGPGDLAPEQDDAPRTSGGGEEG